MSIRQFKNKRDANEPEIVAALRAHNFTVARLDTPVDLVISRKGRTWLAEVKLPKGKLTDAQREFVAAWPDLVPVFRSVEDVAAFSRETRGWNLAAERDALLRGIADHAAVDEPSMNRR